MKRLIIFPLLSLQNQRCSFEYLLRLLLSQGTGWDEKEGRVDILILRMLYCIVLYDITLYITTL
jgi:hypothetical protein